jgi:hypothetical protein
MLLVAILHVMAYWATSSSINLPLDRKPTALEWVFIASPRTVVPTRSNAADATERPRVTAPPPKLLAAPLTSPDAVSMADSSTDHPPGKPAADWNSELELVAKSAAEANASEQGRAFGFPPRHAPTAKAPTFDWDRVHTHRVEIGAEGGMIVHLSDKCVMVFMPFPFAACGIGKKEANGHLLDHMQDAPGVAEASAP